MVKPNCAKKRQSWVKIKRRTPKKCRKTIFLTLIAGVKAKRGKRVATIGKTSGYVGVYACKHPCFTA